MRAEKHSHWGFRNSVQKLFTKFLLKIRLSGLINGNMYALEAGDGVGGTGCGRASFPYMVVNKNLKKVSCEIAGLISR